MKLQETDGIHRRCLQCGYPLDHLTENRCPECALGFDPHDPATFADAYGRRSVAGSNSGLWVIALLGTFLTFLALSLVPLTGGVSCVVGLVGPVLVLVCVVLSWRKKRRAGSNNGSVNDVFLFATIALSLIIVLGVLVVLLLAQQRC